MGDEPLRRLSQRGLLLRASRCRGGAEVGRVDDRELVGDVAIGSLEVLRAQHADPGRVADGQGGRGGVGLGLGECEHSDRDDEGH